MYVSFASTHMGVLDRPGGNHAGHVILLGPSNLNLHSFPAHCHSAGNNSQSSDIVRPNFENVRPISHYDWT